jgi:hypothetical protein
VIRSLHPARHVITARERGGMTAFAEPHRGNCPTHTIRAADIKARKRGTPFNQLCLIGRD